jgi:hypothetical protein
MDYPFEEFAEIAMRELVVNGIAEFVLSAA